jgi:tetratricopeptide (TPR) repeat protein
MLFWPWNIGARAQTPAEHQKQVSGIQSASPSPAAAASAAGASGTTAPNPGLGKAKSLFENGDLDQAETATREFLKTHEDSAEAHFLLGHILFEELHEKYQNEEKKEGENFRYSGRVDGSLAEVRDAKARESLAEFSAGAKYGPLTAADFKTVAFDYVLLRDNSSADKWLTRSLNLEPQDAQGWFYLGRVKYSQDEFAGAIEAFERCLKLEPRNVFAEYNVGLSFEGLRQKDEAIQAYQNAIAWQANSNAEAPEPFLYLGKLYLEDNQPEKAVPYLVQAVAAFPGVSLAHEELGKAYSNLNQLPQAQQELEKAVSLSPNLARLHIMLGQVYRSQRMMDKAKAEFQKAEELNGTHSSEGSQNKVIP